VFERFGERARQVVVFAQDEARQLGHNYIGTEHLLLGLLREDEGLAARSLESVGVTLAGARACAERIVGRGAEVPTGQIPFTPRGKKVLERSLIRATRLGHDYVGTEHILLGLVSIGEGVALRVLRDSGVEPERLEETVIRTLRTQAQQHGPGERVAERFEPQSPPLAADVAAELARLSREKEEALQRQDFERAARLHDRERKLIDACRRLIRVWNESDELT
jgi:ATP-dependent Clp protease ATP-binding subunit ClpC